MEKIIISRVCPFCGKTFTKSFDKKTYEDGIAKYNTGTLIQKAFPTFTPDEREFLMTGICNDCWHNM